MREGERRDLRVDVVGLAAFLSFLKVFWSRGFCWFSCFFSRLFSQWPTSKDFWSGTLDWPSPHFNSLRQDLLLYRQLCVCCNSVSISLSSLFVPQTLFPLSLSLCAYFSSRPSIISRRPCVWNTPNAAVGCLDKSLPIDVIIRWTNIKNKTKWMLSNRSWSLPLQRNPGRGRGCSSFIYTSW